MTDNSCHDRHLINFKGIKALRSTHPGVRRLKRSQQGHSAHGNKVWRSSFVLIDYLSSKQMPKQSQVLDIGCGWGLAGIYLARQKGAQVTGLDIDKTVEPFLQLQAGINDCTINFSARRFQSLKSGELAGYHTLMGTDICFWDELTSPLFKLIKRATTAGTPQILIADPGRPPFWTLAERCVAKLGAEVITRRISQPWKTEKYILTLGVKD